MSQSSTDRREFGYITSDERSSQWVCMPKGQNISGYNMGIIYIENVWYPMVPGNVVNAHTYDFPVRMKAVRGLDTPKLHAAAPEAWDAILEAAMELRKEGVRAISGACGFFGHFQSQLADVLDIPVALSSLVQIPWIESSISRRSRIGVLTANAVAVTPQLLENCGISDADRLAIKDLRHAPHFSAIMEDRGCFDNTQVRMEVVAAAEELVRDNPDVSAICLECSDMPPYAYAVQRAVQLPVFDFTTMIRWLNNSVSAKPYAGWI
ncbi:aspartate/glutamate racemase family protein [Brooklawnia sp.]|uniref:aspartate/glutamate racemase family protein n=1 Tax=Brooklawnia sp. TaxID=2699740 RepID=UPI00311FC754